MESFRTIILAAGLGKRMKTSTPKVLHKILGKAIVSYVIDAAYKAGSADVALVVGNGAELVKKELADYGGIRYYLQEKQLGTGHAVMSAADFVPVSGTVVILQGDTPFTSPETIRRLVSHHEANGNGLTFMSVTAPDPTGFGRIVRDRDGRFVKNVEHRDASPAEMLIDEVNAGVYCFEAKVLKTALSELSNNNAQNEYYFTDTLEISRSKGVKIDVLCSKDFDEFLGINTLSQLAQAGKVIKERINAGHMSAGVVFADPGTAYIGSEVVIGADTVIYPNTIIEGRTVIGQGCVIGPNTTIRNTTIGDGAEVANSVVVNSAIGRGTTVGPFAYIRPGSSIGEKVKIGDFVEVKNSTVGNGTKISHLTYVGDADVGAGVNLGCGTVTGNYDGVNKHRTRIEDNAFIGCNTNLIAPIKVGEGAYIAAGSTITRDVPAHALSVARARQEDKPGWADRHR